MKANFVFLLTAAIFLAACNTKPASNSNDNTGSATSDTTAKADTSGKLNTPAPVAVISDTQFLATAYNIGLFEIKISKLALQKSSDKNVKTFAAMIIHDHTAANINVKALLLKKNYAVPVELPADLMDKAKELSALNGNDFDKKYATINVDGHKGAIVLFTRVSTEGKDADVRQLAASEIPTLQKHEEHAQKLLTEITTP
jgi:putative membrane protein